MRACGGAYCRLPSKDQEQRDPHKRQAHDKPRPPGRRGDAPKVTFEASGPPIHDEGNPPPRAIDSAGAAHAHGCRAT